METVTTQFITNNIFLGNCKQEEEIQNWKENLAAIVRQIPNGENELKPVIQFLVAVLQPSRIYRINHPSIEIDSKKYIDLMIVLPTSSQKSFIELEPVLEIPYVNNELVSCSLHNEGNLKENLSRGHIFYSLHCMNENIVYDNSKTEYPVPTLLTINEMKQQIKEGFQQDIQKAINFREAAELLMENKSSQIVAFFLHQSIELTYRNVLKHLEGYDKKTHSLQALRKYIRRSAPQLYTIFNDDTQEKKQMNEILEDAYISARYNSDFNIEDTIISNILNQVTLLQDCSVSLIEKQTIQSVNT
ncbi:MAG: HEPN domain-containing protein [Arachidicoccus sp.]|nr:HEPN domain-containing protein [Arachidicoccus sp.]